jgi:SAM-dependent methyltransferase
MQPRRQHACRLLCALALACAWPVALRAQDEVPFITTPDNVTLAMLELAQVGPTDFVLDLGSGDGRIVIQAAKRFGARGLGVEIVPELVERSRKNADLAGVGHSARFVVQDLFGTDLSVATVITMYLLQEVNLQLRPSLLALRPGTRVVSHDWDMGDWKPDRTVTVDAPDKAVGLEKRSRLHLWVVPVKASGIWCGTGAHGGVRLRLAQRFQTFDSTLAAAGATHSMAGRINGARLQAKGGFDAVVEGEGSRLRVSHAGAWPAALQGADFERCAS